MRINSLVIDGFKSYAVRTEVTFDATFTAITGLNGSGKSNILDSICFVLGITNMSTLRAQNLQDLIYKRGQAGVTKASVTIVFANDNKKTAPVGFSPDDFPTISVTRQIMMGGVSKYLINGHRAQQQTVQNLFQSVQLNINNPNFLIMQGKITKVLNMKPLETLSMIEEAAGTRMFEERKEKAIKNIAKKEAKVQEINALLAEEIEPKLEKLRSEKRSWMEFQQVQSEYERTMKIVVAHDHDKLSNRLSRGSSDLAKKTEAIDTLEQLRRQTEQELKHIEEDVRRINVQREQEMRKGGKFSKLEKETKDLSHEIVRLVTNIELKSDAIRDEEAELARASLRSSELAQEAEAQQSSFKKVEAAYLQLKETTASMTAEFQRKEDLLQTLSTGISAKEGQDGGYLNLLSEANARLSKSTTEQEQCKVKIAHYEKRLKDDEPRAKKARTQNAALHQDLASMKSSCSTIEHKIRSLGVDMNQHDAMLKRQSELKSEIAEHNARAEVLRRKVANMEFTYTDPTSNFDRTQVKGLVAQLFTLDEKNFASATALEICAGGRLYNVVVANETIGSQLLSHGKLRKRVTIIPLNKISAFTATADRIGAAKKLAPGKVDLALSLIGYEDEVAAAMQYVFGSTLICADADAAKAVTFNKAVTLKSVTLEGDVYDPSGTLSGGSKPNSSGVLVTIQKLNEINALLQAANVELKLLNAKLNDSSDKTKEVVKLQHQADLKKHEIQLAEQQIESNSDARIVKEVEEMRQSITELKQAMIEAKEAQNQARTEIKSIEKDMKEFKSNKNGKLDDLQKEVDKLKVQVDKQNKALKVAHQNQQTGQMELEQLQSDVEMARRQSEELSVNLNQAKADIKKLQQAHTTVKDQHDVLEAEIADERAKMTGFDQEIGELEAVRRAKQDQISETGLELQRSKHEIEQFAKETQQTQHNLAALCKEHDWIADCQSDFGKENSVFDYTKVNITDYRSSLKQLSDRVTTMRKRVNAKVMDMIDGVEKKENALKQMVRTIHKDKLKIEETIVSLDEYKIEALEKTWRKVTVDFGNIFGDLLPGNTAKLVPLEGKPISSGLEVKVCLGKVWKQSLAELSGGQRSLIALSLIMSLLQYKPAPMYILDEVDAALDLSHTQNIGSLIKTRFGGSQFIVVSLKEGMFTNANRILRTRFVDNTSVVSAS